VVERQTNQKSYIPARAGLIWNHKPSTLWTDTNCWQSEVLCKIKNWRLVY